MKTYGILSVKNDLVNSVHSVTQHAICRLVIPSIVMSIFLFLQSIYTSYKNGYDNMSGQTFGHFEVVLLTFR